MQTWASLDGEHRVHIEQAFVDEAVVLAQKHYPKEVGSSLVGSYSDDGWTATVVASAPLPQDSKAGRMWFVRGVSGLKSYFGKVFARSAGKTHYVGEWHVHPDGDPVPSDEDDRNMMAIVDDSEARCPECILLIVAYSASRTRLRVYVYSVASGRVDLNLVSAG